MTDVTKLALNGQTYIIKVSAEYSASTETISFNKCLM